MRTARLSWSALRAALDRSPLYADVPPDRIEASGRVPAGLRVVAGFATEPVMREIVTWVERHVHWSSGTKHGNRMETWLQSERPLPLWAAEMGTRLIDAGIFRDAPDFLHLIDYKAGSGIPPHTDRDIFQDVVAGLTLQSSRVMEFTHPKRARVRVLLMPGDLYVLSGEARYKWEHGVPFERIDRFQGREYVRKDGMSASWRCLVPGVL
jgi:alkylated DNA repair dioxygenase AlkB